MGRRRCRWATPAATRAEGAVVFAWVEEDVRVAPAWAEGSARAACDAGASVTLGLCTPDRRVGQATEGPR